MDAMTRYMTGKQDAREHTVGASDVGACYRQLAYRYFHVEPTNPRGTEAADLGTLIHLGWSAMIGSTYPPEQRSADVSLTLDELPRPVNADDVDWETRTVTDVKTAKNMVWQRWLNEGSPYEAYWTQLEVYGTALRRKYGGDWTLRIVAINRETGMRHEFVRDHDPEVGEAAVARQAERHLRLTEAAAYDQPVDDFPREGRGPGRGMPCDFCAWVDACWPPVGPDDPLSPQSKAIAEDFTAIAAYAGDYLEASAAEAKAKAAKGDARAFLVGLDGEFGDYRVGWSGGEPKEPVPDCAAMEALLVERGIDVPMTDGGVTARRISVRRRAR